jgi:prepilin-type N-terminal cleavage/methylation domain-containing protein
MNKKGLTLLEIIISVIILALIMTGLVNVFVSGKKLIQHSKMRRGGGEIGKKFLDPLQGYVRQDTWSTNPLGSDKISKSTQGDYSSVYEASTHSKEANIKKVKATISWTE